MGSANGFPMGCSCFVFLFLICFFMELKTVICIICSNKV